MPEDSATLLFELMVLLDECMTHNQGADITGALAYRNGAFLQVLEGPEAAVDTLYDKIRYDRRHCDVRLIAKEKCGQRCFADWAMAYLGNEHDLRAHFDSAQHQMTPAAANEVVSSLASMLA